MVKAYVGLGSNIGDRKKNIRASIKLLKKIAFGDDFFLSPLFCYAPLEQNKGGCLNRKVFYTFLCFKKTRMIYNTKSSSLYETSPINMPVGTRKFINCVLEFDTKLSPQRLLKILNSIESELGRNRKKKQKREYISRIIDLDILFYGNKIINDRNLTIPHPELAERKFVLKPLIELNPDLIHPVKKKTIKKLYSEFRDKTQKVVKL